MIGATTGGLGTTRIAGSLVSGMPTRGLDGDGATRLEKVEVPSERPRRSRLGTSISAAGSARSTGAASSAGASGVDSATNPAATADSLSTVVDGSALAGSVTRIRPVSRASAISASSCGREAAGSPITRRAALSPRTLASANEVLSSVVDSSRLRRTTSYERSKRSRPTRRRSTWARASRRRRSMSSRIWARACSASWISESDSLRALPTMAIACRRARSWS